MFKYPNPAKPENVSQFYKNEKIIILFGDYLS